VSNAFFCGHFKRAKDKKSSLEPSLSFPLLLVIPSASLWALSSSGGKRPKKTSGGKGFQQVNYNRVRAVKGRIVCVRASQHQRSDSVVFGAPQTPLGWTAYYVKHRP